MAVETTTILGKVLLPSGQPATSGNILAELNAPGTALDGAVLQSVSGRVEAAIAADGSVNFALVPNSVINVGPLQQNSNYYRVTITVDAPVRTSWTEKWSIVTNPDPINIGAIARL